MRTVHLRGNAVELTRDPSGNVTKVRQTKIGAAAWTPHADNIVETFTYEPLFHHVATATDPLGRTTAFVYDHQLSESPRGLLRKVMPPAVGGTNPEIEHTYDAHG